MVTNKKIYPKTYCIYGQELNHVDLVRNLSVEVDNKLM